MKPMTIANRRILATLVAGGALVAAGTAFAQTYVVPPPRYEEPAPAPGVSVTIGMHGDRYWDGHRYWEHEAWMHRHPRERDPWREHEHEHEHMHEHEYRE
ncbi:MULTISPECIES: hypothetical protein [unclassified Burkholderia]|uniref:hypothetical protein n=1 Tax=unclassified Burkholderia TaxID=2613784 RepID=UPI0005CE96EF|nr:MULTISPECIES: hypothetical protein [unclassified Burkholderia]RQR46187.1 hypothetical protein DIE20_03305 [Burkholderia sp. Bp9131]RQR78651.1 hypothetical protein DIE12_03045 [Burkholderia sp. Bp9015]RQR81725.1 hypothetical protein DIE10_16725 [Burkholderia sp. Bp9011]RQR91424.1 hypothetical protein DIE09_18960 [Burkholderia sp. Bp9010]RQS05042.1 hypothetical protein DIE02_16620 [Burkholderia sp. Bp8991]